MIHLFNKVYLELDDKLNLDFDRAVLGKNGVSLASGVELATKGILMYANKNFPEDFSGFISNIKDYTDKSNKKFIVYADSNNYKKFMVSWYKSIFPSANKEAIEELVHITVYKERILSNSQLQAGSSTDSDSILESFKDIGNYIDESTVNSSDTKAIKDMGLSLSYEFMLADYFSGSEKHTTRLKKIIHMFLQRWFVESFTDNREMILHNLYNDSFQKALGYNSANIDITDLNPLSQIESLKAYSDPTIWGTDLSGNISSYNQCRIEGISKTKADAMRKLLLKTYNEVEGMEIDQNIFDGFKFLDYAIKDKMTQAEMDEVVDFIVATPFDTCFIPKFDFENVNYTFLQFILNAKRDGATETLEAYRLM